MIKQDTSRNRSEMIKCHEEMPEKIFMAGFTPQCSFSFHINLKKAVWKPSCLSQHDLSFASNPERSQSKVHSNKKHESNARIGDHPQIEPIKCHLSVSAVTYFPLEQGKQNVQVKTGCHLPRKEKGISEITHQLELVLHQIDLPAFA